MIQIQNTTLHTCMRAKVDMDGVITKRKGVKPGTMALVDKYRPTATTFRRLVFSPAKLVGELLDEWFSVICRNNWRALYVDDDEVPLQVSNIAGLGIIQVTMDEGTVVKSTHSICMDRVCDIPENRLIPERGKKGMLECVGCVIYFHHTLGYYAYPRIYPRQSLGPVQVNENGPAKPSRWSIQTTAVRAIMIFRYRPQGMRTSQLPMYLPFYSRCYPSFSPSSGNCTPGFQRYREHVSISTPRKQQQAVTISQTQEG